MTQAQNASNEAKVKTFSDGSSMPADESKANNPFAQQLAAIKPLVPVVAPENQEVPPPAAKADADVGGAVSGDISVPVQTQAEKPEAGVATPQGDAAPTEGEEGGKRRRRRNRKNAAVAKAPTAAGEEVAGDQSTTATPMSAENPPAATPAPEVKKPEVKTEKPRASGGVRMIQLVQVAPKREDPPKGTIHLRDFLRVVHPRQLLGIAKGITESGATPDVVIWARSSSGSIDYVRIEVVSKELPGRDGPVTVPNLKITEAKGTLQAFVRYIEKDVPEEYRKFENLAQYIGQDIRFVEARNLVGKDGKPRSIPANAERVMRTVTLCALFEASGIHFKTENAKWKARRRPAARKEAPAATAAPSTRRETWAERDVKIAAQLAAEANQEAPAAGEQKAEQQAASAPKPEAGQQ